MAYRARSQQHLAQQRGFVPQRNMPAQLCDQPGVPGNLLFLGAGWPNGRCDLPMTDGAGCGPKWASKNPAGRYQQGHSQGLRPEARLWLSCCLWPDLLSRTKGRGVLGGRGDVRQRGSAVDGFDHLHRGRGDGPCGRDPEERSTRSGGSPRAAAWTDDPHPAIWSSPPVRITTGSFSSR